MVHEIDENHVACTALQHLQHRGVIRSAQQAFQRTLGAYVYIFIYKTLHIYIYMYTNIGTHVHTGPWVF